MRIDRDKRSKGFTLTELLAVMAILGILAGLVTGAIVGLGTRGQEARLEGDRETIRKAANQFSVEAFPEVFPVVELDDTDASIVPTTDIGVRLIDFKARLPQDPTKKFVPDFLSTLPGSSALVSWRIDTRSGNVFFASNGADLILPSSNRLDIAASNSEVSALSDYTFDLLMGKNEAAVDTLEIRIPAGYSLGGQFAPAGSLMGVLKITLDTDNEADSGQQVHLGGVLVATGEANQWSLVVNYNDNVSTSGSSNVTVKPSAEAVRVHTVTIVPPSGTSAGSLTLDVDRGSDDAENKATELWELTILGQATTDLSSVNTVPSTSPSATGGIDSSARSIDTTDGFAVTGGSSLTSTVSIITNPSTAAVKRWLSEENTSIDPEIGTARFFNSVAGDQGVLIKDPEEGGTLPGP